MVIVAAWCVEDYQVIRLAGSLTPRATRLAHGKAGCGSVGQNTAPTYARWKATHQESLALRRHPAFAVSSFHADPVSALSAHPGPLWGLPRDAYAGLTGLADQMSSRITQQPDPVRRNRLPRSVLR